MAPKILIILTSHDKMGDTGKPTGWYLPELAHPYDVFKAANAELTIASPKGGAAPLDPSSVQAFEKDPSSVSFLNNHKDLWSNTVKLDTLVGQANKFDAVFVPGGHGPMFDLATDTTSQQILAEFATAGKVVAAVCHGPAALVGVRLPPGEGKYLLAGKKVTGFSNTEEDQMQLSKVMPFMLEDRLGEVSGGGFVKADEPWGVKVVVDGKLITGQNPASAKAIGEAIIKALG